MNQRQLRTPEKYRMSEGPNPSLISMCCGLCKAFKFLDAFSKSSVAWTGRHTWCKDCAYKLYWSDERAEKREIKKAKLRQRYQENKVEHNRIVKAYALAHPEVKKRARDKYRAKNREAIRIKGREYFTNDYAKDPAKWIARAKNQRHALAGVPGKVTAQEWRDRLAEFNNCCAFCLQLLTKETQTQEHMRPKSKKWGGTHTIDNIIPACRSCNSRKQNRPILHWMIAEMRVAKLAT